MRGLCAAQGAVYARLMRGLRAAPGSPCAAYARLMRGLCAAKVPSESFCAVYARLMRGLCAAYA
eukprot:11192163-Lingulodinium_polyedra.AAC.1